MVTPIKYSHSCRQQVETDQSLKLSECFLTPIPAQIQLGKAVAHVEKYTSSLGSWQLGTSPNKFKCCCYFMSAIWSPAPCLHYAKVGLRELDGFGLLRNLHLAPGNGIKLQEPPVAETLIEDEWEVVLVKTKRLHGAVLTHLLFMLFSDVNTRIIRIQSTSNSNISRSVNKRGSPFQSWLSRSGWTRGWDCDASNDLQVLQKAHKSVFPGTPRIHIHIVDTWCLVFLQGCWNTVKSTT